MKLAGDGLTRLIWRPQGAAGQNGRSPSVLQERGREANVAPALKTALGSRKQPLAVSQSPGNAGGGRGERFQGCYLMPSGTKKHGGRGEETGNRLISTKTHPNHSS